MRKTKWLALLLAAGMLVSCTGTPADETETDDANAVVEETQAEVENNIPEALQNQKHTLRFDENGEFRILVFADVQSDMPEVSLETRVAMRRVVDWEEPDLVLFAGDNSWQATSEEELRAYLETMVGYIEEKQIPWAHVYGNHDDEGGVSRESQQVVYESFEYCISKAGPEEIKGVGNYVLPVYSSDTSNTTPQFAVWGLDSGRETGDAGLMGNGALLPNRMYEGHGGVYAYMPFSQIRWYYNTSEELETYYGTKIPSLMYFHIPLQEFYEVYLNREVESVNFTGQKAEDVCASPINSGMFAALVERGDVKAVVCGHDHVNNYTGDYCGVKLCYAGSITYDFYNDINVTGARVFVVKEENPSELETYISYAYGAPLAALKSIANQTLTFDADEIAYMLKGEGITTVAGEGYEGSTGLKITGQGRLDFSAGGGLGRTKYLKMWVSVPEGSKLTEVTVEAVAKAHTADLATVKFFALAKGEEEWTTIEKDSGGLPEGFEGWIALSLGNFKYDGKEALAMGSHAFSYSFACEGEVVVDDLVWVAKYK